MIIGVTGKAGSGKDTFFHRALELSGRMGIPTPTRLAFADKLKESASLLLGVSVDDLNHFKNDDSTGHLTVLGRPMSIRSFLQRYGTESHRDVFGPDFWVDALLPYSMVHQNEILIITDVRFENEAVRIRSLGGSIVNVAGVDDHIARAASDHVSENGIANIDWEVDNSDRSSFANLDYQVRNILSQYTGECDETELGDPHHVEHVHRG